MTDTLTRAGAPYDAAAGKAFINGVWDAEIVPALVEYIRIPNKSPAFDPQWAEHGYMEQAVTQFEAWARTKADALGATVEVVRLEGRTPVILIDVPGQGSETILLYGHLDKQPEMAGWDEDLGPWKPVIKGDKLYGRGGADDGYAMFGSITSLLALKAQGVAHSRCVVLIEACEESGSTDLPYYVDHLQSRFGDVSLVICLDSGCGNYDQMWLTTSLRGLASGELTVRVLEEGVHSGDASGVVPSSFRILRQLMERIEDQTNGDIKLKDLYVEIPAKRIEQARKGAQILGEEVFAKFPFAGKMRPVNTDPVELVLNRTWRPQLATVGMAGLPEPQSAGNVLRPYTTAKLSLRLPPTANAPACVAHVKEVLEADPPYGATVEFKVDGKESGWNAPEMAPWLESSVERASQAAFGKPVAMMGEGGSIPFMGMLGQKFPRAQFVITGVLGPHSNAHGPNEFLHIPTGKRVTEAVASIVADHAAQAG